MAVAIIPARAGSQRIPNKNFKDFYGKPIIQYSVDTARKSGLFSSVIITTDNKDINEFTFGTMVVRRPKYYSQDHVGTQEVIANAILEAKVDDDYVCCIYATAPMLSPVDLWKGFNILGEKDAYYAFSVGAYPLRDAGQFYFGKRAAFLNGYPLIGDRTRMIPVAEKRICDINTPEDWKRAEQMYAKLHGIES